MGVVLAVDFVRSLKYCLTPRWAMAPPLLRYDQPMASYVIVVYRLYSDITLVVTHPVFVNSLRVVVTSSVSSPSSCIGSMLISVFWGSS